MNRVSKERVIAFAKELASKLWKIDRTLVYDKEIRTSNIVISLESQARLAEAEEEGAAELYRAGKVHPDGWCRTKKKLESIVPRVAEDESIAAVLFCEGDLWESLYYSEAYGTSEEEKKEAYKAFVSLAAKHGFWYEWGSGVVFLYSITDEPENKEEGNKLGIY